MKDSPEMDMMAVGVCVCICVCVYICAKDVCSERTAVGELEGLLHCDRGSGSDSDSDSERRCRMTTR